MNPIFFLHFYCLEVKIRIFWVDDDKKNIQSSLGGIPKIKLIGQHKKLREPF